MELVRTNKYRLYPNAKQKALLDEMFNLYRFTYNNVLGKIQDSYFGSYTIEKGKNKGQKRPKIPNQTGIVGFSTKLKEEYRFFMYKNEILGCSRYMLNGKVNPDSFVPDNVKNAAEYFGLQYNPAEIYVMDLCTFENTDEIKIVEYNCWNCSGFYHCDIRSIIRKINYIKS